MQLCIKNYYLLKTSYYRQIIAPLLQSKETQANRYSLQNQYLCLSIKKVSEIML